MKVKFTTLDIKVLVSELKKKLTGMRVNNVYDIDSKTYLIKLNRTDEKAILLLESGIRLHTTEFEWPKNIIPSGFAMKLRKHLRGRRLESIEQLGVDRIIDMQFGSGEAAYHVILEMYDRGNIVLTDYEYMILNIQRPRTDNNQDVKFIVKEKYPIQLAKQHQGIPTRESILEILESTKPGGNLKKILVPHSAYGGHLIEHCLLEVGLKASAKINSEFQAKNDVENVLNALCMAEEMMQKSCETPMQGFIINQKEKKAGISGVLPEEVLIYSEFHPFLFKQHANESHIEFDSFDKAVDEFYSKIESQKQDRKLLQQENAAIKKLEHIKSDNQDRVKGLKEEQLNDMKRAWLIELNLDLVDEAIELMRNALAHQLDWTELKTMMEEAAGSNHVVGCIKALKLDTNHINMLLKPPEKMGIEDADGLSLGPMKIDIDLGISAYANARKYYDMKRHAAMKEMKTSDALQKAYKSAEKKTLQVLKEVHTVATINKARKTHWFEKFLWFISSENYVVIGGRDQQQNELIVKRYLKPGDIYVHADLHGASSVIIKNPTRNPVPPVTLNEAGTMALCNSAAWEAKVVTSSWWVYHDQVSKTAPTGEYLTTGSFMIRGKKNYLLPSSLIYGFGFLFKVDETCVDQHRNERKVKGKNDEADEAATETVEVELKENDDNDDDDQSKEKNDNGDCVKTECENQGEIIEVDDKDRVDVDVDCVNEGGKNDKDRYHEDKKESEDENKEDDDDDDDNHNHIEENGEDDDCETSNVLAETESHVLECVDDDVVEMFPDTQIKLDHLTSIESEVQGGDAGDVNEKKSARMSAKQRRDAKKGGDKTDKGGKSKVENNPLQSTHSSVMKRGQKSKLKKIKEKYGDQDDEERELRMQLLASDRAPKEEKSKKKSKGGSKQQQQTANQKSSLKKQQVNNLKQAQKIGDVVMGEESKEAIDVDGNLPELQKIDQEDIDQEDDIKQVQQETDMLDSLTGIPYPDDVLLYCVPVCAPWNALINYRFKVKLMPGTSKRGKAAKMVISMFMQDKSTTPLEKDLLRSIKDTDLSRNMPGKVKVSVTKSLHKK